MHRALLPSVLGLASLALAMAPGVVRAQLDPRIRITELQAADRLEEALQETRSFLNDDPTRARALGLPYLEGHLLERMGRVDEAMTAFAEVFSATPSLSEHARLRIAMAQERLGHPEVAAGLSATLLGNQPSDALVTPAVDLLERTLAQGGDCRLLSGLAKRGLPRSARRRIELSRALCQLRQGGRHDGVAEDLVALLREERTDLTGLLAAEQLFALQRNPSEDLVRQLGETFHHHRRFDRADPYLRRVVSAQPAIATVEDFEIHYRLVRGEFWRGQFDVAAINYGALASRTTNADQRAQALYHRGRALELSGQWADAIGAFRESYQAQKQGDYSGAALLSAMRLEWRMDRDAEARQLYRQLAAHPDARSELARGALFLASSEIARGDVQRRRGGELIERGASDEIEAWLDTALGASRQAETEVLYWRGRWYENRGQDRRAADAYARTLRHDFYHPIAQHALVRLDRMPDQTARRQLAQQALANGDLMSAWVLTGTNTLEGEAVRERLRRSMERDLGDLVPTRTVARTAWPLWGNAKPRPEDQLLALGMWTEGSTAVRRHFPLSDRRLAFTASLELQRGQKIRESLLIAEILHRGLPRRVPSAAVPDAFRRTVYPFAYRFPIESSSHRWGIDPKLLVALIREESRFDPKASSAAAARGLTQFVLPTASRLAKKIGLGRLSALDLQRPEVSIELGAAYLAELSSLSKGLIPAMIAAYNAGEAQSMLWQQHCFTGDPAEYLSKIGFTETRNYVQRVLRGYALYRELYPTPRDARPRA